MAYGIVITETARDMISALPDRRIQRLAAERIDRLAEEPKQQGNALRGPLRGYRSCRAVGQRYRIIYRVDADETIVVVGAVRIRREGDRRDIYALAQRLVRLGLLEP